MDQPRRREVFCTQMKVKGCESSDRAHRSTAKAREAPWPCDARWSCARLLMCRKSRHGCRPQLLRQPEPACQRRAWPWRTAACAHWAGLSSAHDPAAAPLVVPCPLGAVVGVRCWHSQRSAGQPLPQQSTVPSLFGRGVSARFDGPGLLMSPRPRRTTGRWPHSRRLPGEGFVAR